MCVMSNKWGWMKEIRKYCWQCGYDNDFVSSLHLLLVTALEMHSFPCELTTSLV